MKRTIAVERHQDYRPRRRFTEGAQIRLKGAWLKEIGFEPGQTVTIDASQPGTLMIQAQPKGGAQ